MVAPLVPYAIRGAIWCQGTSNSGDGRIYAARMEALVNGWRDAWGMPDMPFYFVQIAPYNYNDTQGNVAALRDAQRRTLDLPNTGMAVALDVGEAKSIHPRNKQEVGRRLALQARAVAYGERLVAEWEERLAAYSQAFPAEGAELHRERGVGDVDDAQAVAGLVGLSVRQLVDEQHDLVDLVLGKQVTRQVVAVLVERASARGEGGDQGDPHHTVPRS